VKGSPALHILLISNEDQRCPVGTEGYPKEVLGDCTSQFALIPAAVFSLQRCQLPVDDSLSMTAAARRGALVPQMHDEPGRVEQLRRRVPELWWPSSRHTSDLSTWSPSCYIFADCQTAGREAGQLWSTGGIGGVRSTRGGQNRTDGPRPRKRVRYKALVPTR
jgi:hypothetical protein